MMRIALTLGACALALGLVAQTTAPSYPPIVKEKELYAENDLRGKRAPDFAVETWLNRDAAPDTKGKVVMIDFWATWCGPCRATIPELNEWHHKYGDDLVIIGVSNEAPDVITKFMGDTKMDYAVATDTQRRMGNALGVKGIPHVMIYSADRVVRWQGFPGSEQDPLTAEKLEAIIAANKAAVRSGR